MRTAAAGRDIHERPYADPDQEPISQAGAMSLLPAARAAGAGTIAEVLGVSPRTDVIWPPGGYASDELIGDLAAQGLHQLVLDGASRPLVEALNYTPDARTTNLPAGSSAVLSDPQLTQLAAAARSTNAAAASRFLAETAAATTERPGLTRRLLVALPRTVALDPTAFRTLVQVSNTVAWLRNVGLADLLSAHDDRGDASELARHALSPPHTARTTGVLPPDVDLALGLRSQLSALGEVVSEPSRATANLQGSTLDLVSASWRGHRDELAARQQVATSSVTATVTKLRVLPTTITFLRSSGELQLTIANDLDLPVSDLRLQVVAPSPRLVVQRTQSEPISLQPHTRTSVRVPVRALASGKVDLQARLVAPSGAPIGAVESVQVRVRPTDSWALTVGGAVVVSVFLVGVVRALRRPRRRNRIGDDG
jgi:hypothetical protein